MNSKKTISRRALLTQAAPVLATGLAAISSARFALAQDHTPNAADSRPNEKIWSGEYWTKKGDLSLYIFRKRLGAPKPGEPTKPILFLAHGSSVSARPTYDLTVPGHDDYSVMDKFAEYGFDVWTMDFEGYGKSSIGPGNSDIASGVEDLKLAAEVVARETGQTRFHIYGESSGALRAGAFAMAAPERVDRLALGSFTWTGQGSSTLAKRSENLDFYRTHNRRPRNRDMVRSIFTRDKPGTSDPAVAEAMADMELKFGDSVPTGTYLDMTTRLPLVDPLKVQSPVMIVRGEYDGIATEDDLLNFFRKLPVPDREFVILPGASHSIGLGLNRAQFWHVLRSFLEMPKRMDVQK
ncbi:MAG TPA: alpha/beta fold hydrolase [Candidatus Sulfotelmatobacter sp.]|jgi:pimeloyl-ACP methyl ester carboxylesterase|nr:alpha/beta fold hydrolase [Candidatus Sulfotelmatobacter sp.]